MERTRTDAAREGIRPRDETWYGHADLGQAIAVMVSQLEACEAQVSSRLLSRVCEDNGLPERSAAAGQVGRALLFARLIAGRRISLRVAGAMPPVVASEAMRAAEGLDTWSERARAERCVPRAGCRLDCAGGLREQEGME